MVSETKKEEVINIGPLVCRHVILGFMAPLKLFDLNGPRPLYFIRDFFKIFSVNLDESSTAHVMTDLGKGSFLTVESKKSYSNI